MISPRKRTRIYREGTKVLKSGLPGAFVELGVYRGGGMGVLGGQLAKHPDRQIHLFDRWGDFMVASPEDGKAWQEQFTQENIPALLKQANVDQAQADTREMYVDRWKLPEDRLTFHPGWFTDTLPAYRGDKIAFAHVDADFYESSVSAFEFLDEHLMPTAHLVIDDWFAFPGVKKAYAEWKQKSSRTLKLTLVRSKQALVTVS